MLGIGSFRDLALITMLGVGGIAIGQDFEWRVDILGNVQSSSGVGVEFASCKDLSFVALWLQALQGQMIYRMSAVEHDMTCLHTYTIFDICIYFKKDDGSVWCMICGDYYNMQHSYPK